ncbi:MAG: recombinase family protein, partial [Bacteroidales bacterium]|nr:recombinase family protein [Candidatus Egerieousia equi]
MVTAYLRVSTDKQSVENQRSEIQRFSKNRNLDVQKWVTEVVSGKVKSSNRKIGSLVKRLKKDDVLIVSELSRLSRTLLEIMSLLNIL